MRSKTNWRDNSLRHPVLPLFLGTRGASAEAASPSAAAVKPTPFCPTSSPSAEVADPAMIVDGRPMPNFGVQVAVPDSGLGLGGTFQDDAGG
jgi:hypothetical protein